MAEIAEIDEVFKKQVIKAAEEHGYKVKAAYPFCMSFYVLLENDRELVAGHFDSDYDRYGRCITCGWKMHRLPWSDS